MHDPKYFIGRDFSDEEKLELQISQVDYFYPVTYTDEVEVIESVTEAVINSSKPLPTEVFYITAWTSGSIEKKIQVSLTICGFETIMYSEDAVASYIREREDEEPVQNNLTALVNFYSSNSICPIETIQIRF